MARHALVRLIVVARRHESARRRIDFMQLHIAHPGPNARVTDLDQDARISDTSPVFR